MEGLKIRKAEKSDAPALAALLVQVGEVHSRGRPDIYVSRITKHDAASASALIAGGDCGVLVAELGGEVAGELIYKITDRVCDGFYKARRWLYIDDLCVDRAHRGGGIAGALVKRAEEIAAENDCDAVELNCWSFNSGAARFYEELGYRPQKTEYEKILKIYENNTEDKNL